MSQIFQSYYSQVCEKDDEKTLCSKCEVTWHCPECYDFHIKYKFCAKTIVEQTLGKDKRIE